MPLAFWLMAAAALARATTAMLMYLHPASHQPGLRLFYLLAAALHLILPALADRTEGRRQEKLSCRLPETANSMMAAADLEG